MKMIMKTIALIMLISAFSCRLKRTHKACADEACCKGLGDTVNSATGHYETCTRKNTGCSWCLGFITPDSVGGCYKTCDKGCGEHNGKTKSSCEAGGCKWCPAAKGICIPSLGECEQYKDKTLIFDYFGNPQNAGRRRK